MVTPTRATRTRATVVAMRASAATVLVFATSGMPATSASIRTQRRAMGSCALDGWGCALLHLACRLRHGVAQSNGGCNCYTNFKGGPCDQCQNSYYAYPICRCRFRLLFAGPALVLLLTFGLRCNLSVRLHGFDHLQRPRHLHHLGRERWPVHMQHGLGAASLRRVLARLLRRHVQVLQTRHPLQQPRQLRRQWQLRL